MELIWANGQLSAKDIASVIKEYIGWEKNTTYTVIKRLIDKGVIERTDPGFICKPLIEKETVQKIETSIHIKQLYNGKISDFIHEYLANQDLTIEDIYEMSVIVDSFRNGSSTYLS
ncbi:MAG: BlaI/MecI/CopY family transcriptional regulator [Lachnospiraceae bacterium]|nr:BlaI/MecI/CopY family transcriptional regulator [Lachnospiraceae bacterium]